MKISLGWRGRALSKQEPLSAFSFFLCRHELGHFGKELYFHRSTVLSPTQGLPHFPL